MDLMPTVTVLADEEVLFAVGGASAITAIVMSFARSMVVSKEREETKRELAAHVAAGALDPDKAVAIIKAGKGDDEDEE